jgi:allantoate deiminase
VTQARAAKPGDSPLEADPDRIGARISQLAEVGGLAGGITRLAYSEEERHAHELFARWGEEAGKPVEVDEAGNSVIVWNPGSPYFLLGSHLDTVPAGGAYDGAAGVVAALETASLLEGRITRGLRIVAFAGEEGARFGRPSLGSASAAGLLRPQDASRLRDLEGMTLAEAAGRLGFAPGSGSPWIGTDVVCFFEVHIEQGRRLEGGAFTLGLVDGNARRCPHSRE